MANIGFLCDSLKEEWYPNYLLSELTNSSDHKFSAFVFDDQNSIEKSRSMHCVKSYSYWYKIPIKCRSLDISLIHIQFEMVGFGNLYGTLFVPMFLLLLKAFDIDALVTIHGPIYSSEDIWKKSKVIAPKNIFAPFVFPYIYILFSLIGVFANGIIVHSEVFKDRINALPIYCPCEIYVVHHGV